jgi:hypothetical protein
LEFACKERKGGGGRHTAQLTFLIEKKKEICIFSKYVYIIS